MEFSVFFFEIWEGENFYYRVGVRARVYNVIMCHH